jgi:hypothetical protein
MGISLKKKVDPDEPMKIKLEKIVNPQAFTVE